MPLKVDSNDVVVLSARRSPMGAFQGNLSSLSAPKITAQVIQAALKTLPINMSINEVFLGNVISAGIGQAPARQASLSGGLDNAIPCSTISKVCGSGMQAIMFAQQAIESGAQQCVLAGGMESMSNAPYILPRVRQGLRLGHSEAKDAMFFDGLEDAETGKLMGYFGQLSADNAQLTREAMDDFAVASLSRAIQATDNGDFMDEIVPIQTRTRKGDLIVDCDEQVSNAKPEKIRALKPAFSKDGTLTAANSSSISDGAATLVLSDASYAIEHGVQPLAKIVASVSHAQQPSEFTSAPIYAIEKVLQKAEWSIADVDLFEVNEAFALVPMLAMQALKIPHQKMNINGGACGLGHPLGASGARIVVTLIHALKKRGLSKGVAAICIGGGEATAIALQVL